MSADDIKPDANVRIRSHRSLRLGLLAFSAVAIAACDASVVTTPQLVDTVHVTDTVHTVDTVHVVDTVLTSDTVVGFAVYAVAFHQDSASQDKSCPGYLYCFSTEPDSAAFTGSLTQTADSIIAVFDKTIFDPLPLTSVHLDSLPTQFRIYAQNPALTLNVTRSGHTLRGRWVYQIDGHGRIRTGTLVATLK